MEQILVTKAECRTGSNGELLSAVALGSCVGLAVFDPKAHAGGMLHFMLPDSSIDRARAAQKPFMFADSGIPMLLAAVESLGASRSRLRAYAAGGAGMFEGEALFDIGIRNDLALRRLLWRLGIMLEAEVLGGAVSRTLHLDLAAGRVWLQEGSVFRDLNRLSSERRMPWPSAS